MRLTLDGRHRRRARRRWRPAERFAPTISGSKPIIGIARRSKLPRRRQTGARASCFEIARRDCDQQAQVIGFGVFRGRRMPNAVVLETNLDGLTLARRGKVRDVYDLGDAPAHRRHRSHLGVRLRPRLGHSRQGQGAHAAVGVLVRSRRRPRAASRGRRRRRHVPGRHAAASRHPARPLDAGARRPSRCRSNASRAATSPGSGWKDYQQTGAVCGVSLPAGLRESDRLPQSIFTPATKAESGHDENISEAAGRRRSSAHELIPRLRDLTLEHLRARRRARRRARHHHRGHQVRVRLAPILRQARGATADGWN